MSMDLHYDANKKILACLCKGPLSADEFKATLALIVSSQEYPPDVNLLWDVREVDANSFDKSLVSRVVSIRQNYPQRGDAKLALVASEDLHFGLSRMYEMMTDEMPQNIHVFRTTADAEAWLTN